MAFGDYYTQHGSDSASIRSSKSLAGSIAGAFGFRKAAKHASGGGSSVFGHTLGRHNSTGGSRVHSSSYTDGRRYTVGRRSSGVFSSSGHTGKTDKRAHGTQGWFGGGGSTVSHKSSSDGSWFGEEREPSPRREGSYQKTVYSQKVSTPSAGGGAGGVFGGRSMKRRDSSTDSWESEDAKMTRRRSEGGGGLFGSWGRGKKDSKKEKKEKKKEKDHKGKAAVYMTADGNIMKKDGHKTTTYMVDEHSADHNSSRRNISQKV